MGRIGSELSRRAIAFGMRVVASIRIFPLRAPGVYRWKLVMNSTILLTHADFISLHTPLTAATRHILGGSRAVKQKQKHGVRIINCARAA